MQWHLKERCTISVQTPRTTTAFAQGPLCVPTELLPTMRLWWPTALLLERLATAFVLSMLFIPTKYYQYTSKGISYGVHKEASTYVTQQQKLSWKRARTQPKFGGWLSILNLTCILQWFILLQTSNEINASLQKLLNSNQNRNPTTKTKSNKRAMMALESLTWGSLLLCHIFFLQLKLKTFQWFYQLSGHELVDNEKRNILVKLIS